MKLCQILFKIQLISYIFSQKYINSENLYKAFHQLPSLNPHHVITETILNSETAKEIINAYSDGESKSIDEMIYNLLTDKVNKDDVV